MKTLAFIIGILAVGIHLQAAAQTASAEKAQPAAQSASQPQSAANVTDEKPAQRTIVVSLEDRKLALVEDGAVKKVYSVAVGKPSTPSPEGNFTIQRRVRNPYYEHEGKRIAPGPGNPVGTRWMGLSIKGYGIHGTNEPRSIGKAASHGCIRMARADLEEFYELVAAGDTVEIIGQRNEETARLFQPREVQPQAQPVQLAESKAEAPRTAEAAEEKITPANPEKSAAATEESAQPAAGQR
jgi:lipoprotein-anchoring transpeptidase ErfK/SrfK